MKNIFTLAPTPVAIAVAALVTAMVVLPSVEAATYKFEWKSIPGNPGNPITNGYSAKGQFSYDDKFQGNIITPDELSSFSVSFFNPTNTLLGTYGLPASTDNFNFNFDSQTNTILQSGNYDQSPPFDPVYGVKLGIDPFSLPPNPPNTYAPPGYNFFTYLDQSGVAKLYLNYVTSEDVTLDLDCQLSSSGVPKDEYPKDCGTNLDQGGELVVTSKNLEIPEPTSPLSLLGLGILGGGLTLLKKWVSWK